VRLGNVSMDDVAESQESDLKTAQINQEFGRASRPNHLLTRKLPDITPPGHLFKNPDM